METLGSEVMFNVVDFGTQREERNSNQNDIPLALQFLKLVKLSHDCYTNFVS
jgi:hypothetical protein